MVSAFSRSGLVDSAFVYIVVLFNHVRKLDDSAETSEVPGSGHWRVRLIGLRNFLPNQQSSSVIYSHACPNRARGQLTALPFSKADCLPSFLHKLCI